MRTRGFFQGKTALAFWRSNSPTLNDKVIKDELNKAAKFAVENGYDFLGGVVGTGTNTKGLARLIPLVDMVRPRYLIVNDPTLLEGSDCVHEFFVKTITEQYGVKVLYTSKA